MTTTNKDGQIIADPGIEWWSNDLGIEWWSCEPGGYRIELDQDRRDVSGYQLRRDSVIAPLFHGSVRDCMQVAEVYQIKRVA